MSALALAMLIGLPVGVLSGLRPGGWLDRLTLVWTVAARALPAFLFGLLLILVFSVHLGWVPAAGRGEGRNATVAGDNAGRRPGGTDCAHRARQRRAGDRLRVLPFRAVQGTVADDGFFAMACATLG